ncbi:hypothetical protein CEXT_793081 [Caerostris extrusa]|uniref:Uncharacterized protein n=1 Tax=Caerostris extrusa TaxID=172846 RepID=A0AAV4VFJ5_CAEEX|nr:hypothetical protein CEXT_793081 [Caerostris extrusa]
MHYERRDFELFKSPERMIGMRISCDLAFSFRFVLRKIFRWGHLNGGKKCQLLEYFDDEECSLSCAIVKSLLLIKALRKITLNTGR